ncbi:PilZ domain-containing protein [Denitrobaculum tricleocarpae]|uniref:PilZ domain-containing protein n=1 Tax=Denitrobaculum tricleocarpae TaxID=2591009 RepID=A0A545TQ64_9PROT|nr:PilZ domain-containing protein [Denitrobaculum tricleocarpae]TQV79357.1 PilZ domain-containing protein [Denitrobaculum tricleocarpae]
MASTGRQDQRRRYRRYRSTNGATLRLGSDWNPCSAVDVSGGGVFLETSVRPQIGDPVEMKIDVLGDFTGTVVRHAWNGIGVKFDEVDFKNEGLAMNLANPNRRRFH